MITRFAPSPTGPLHLGHAWSALTAHDMARRVGGMFLLRIEDIDRTRARDVYEAQVLDDLNWLGLTWDGVPMRQSERLETYGAALDRLWRQGLLYPCHCTRRDIAEALRAPQEGAAAPIGPDGPVYPGTCRNLDRDTRAPRPRNVHLRLDMARAVAEVRKASGGLSFKEDGPRHGGVHTPSLDALVHGIGDVVLARRDFGTSYHLSVVIDDAAQGVTHVVRGVDLFDATPIHVVLQRLLDLPTPVYHHHDLVRDAQGKRLAKRDNARALQSYRAAGWTPQALRAHLQRSLQAPDTAPER